MSIIGIDLGTTYCAVAQLDDLGRPNIISINGANITPSVVEFSPEKTLVGLEAKKALDHGPRDNIAQEIKRSMGKKDVFFNFNGEELTPTTISSIILKYLKKEIEKSSEIIKSAVVTVPANFSNEAREATQRAAERAGLPVDFIINEPTAAALNYAFQSGESLSGNYVIYDFGGGTFDCTIAKIKNQDVEILTSYGVSKLGGKDFDSVVKNIVSEKYKKKFNKDLDDKLFSSNQAENIKITLSSRDETNVQIGLDDVTITKDEFLTGISSFIVQADLAIDIALERAGLTKEDIEEVILVGGTTRIPAIQESVTKIFGKEPKIFGNPDEAVALGAAIYAAYKANPEDLNQLQKKAMSEVNLVEVAPYYFGTTFVNSTTQTLENTVLISKDQKVPCSITKTFYTIIDNQESVLCEVTQSSTEEKDPEWVTIVKTENLKLKPNLPRQTPVDITYSYTEDGKMRAVFSAGDDGEDVVINLSISATSEDEIDIDQFKID